MKKILGIMVVIGIVAGAIALLSQKNKIATTYEGLQPILNVSEKSPEPKGAWKLKVFAKGLKGVRDLQFSEGGTLLASMPEAGKVIMLPDADGDGVADKAQEILVGLKKPHGLAVYGGKLFVAEEEAVRRYGFDEGKKQLSLEKKVVDLPKGGRHTTRSLVIDKSGKMYISIGSTCDVCEEKDERLAAVMVTNTEGENPRVYARGLRNAVFIALNPQSGELWGTEMGRDMLGNDIPADEINIIREGKDYGWPYCYGQQVADGKNGLKSDGERCKTTEGPIYEIGAHSAPLGLVFVPDVGQMSAWKGDLLVAYHGSWNRTPPVGYKVVHMKVEGNKITGEEVLFSFLEKGAATGRPVDISFSPKGEAYVSDDAKGIIYKIVNEK